LVVIGRTSQVGRGVLLAFAAAALFGATAPLLQRASAAVGAIAAAGLMYLGAGLTGLLLMTVRRHAFEPALQGRALWRLLLVALLGAALAPTLLVLGLKRTDAATGSLLLVLEAPFTLLLARLFLREHLSLRVVLAMSLILVGGLALAFRPAGGPLSWTGEALIAGATLSWSAENILSRGLADSDPLSVVAGKGILGSAAAMMVAWAADQTGIPLGPAVALVAIGCVGYGLSLQLYLRAMRLVGAGRTASVFAAAPFFGAIIALAMAGSWPGPRFLLATPLMAVGVWLHVTERHHHRHTHEPLLHDHEHSHDDGHHHHRHDPMPAGPHTHPHRHEPVTHEHEHSEDIHHRHPH
jgi:drug/metabolite transporter (DMT)-like permease